jgi:two-component system, response regulator PdtaR
VRVLVVEDDVMLADYLADALEDQGHEVCGIAAAVSDAVDCVRLNHPDIAVIDVQLSNGERGTDITEQLAVSDDLRGLGILYVSGNPDFVSQEARFGHACLTKPYGLVTLASALTIVSDLSKGTPAPSALPRGMRLLGGMRAARPCSQTSV